MASAFSFFDTDYTFLESVFLMSQRSKDNTFELHKISGKIKNYTCTRGSANFIFTKNDKSVLGVIAIAAAVGNVPGLAVSTAASANSEEEADYLEFNLNEKPVKGWVWRSPFADGDQIEAVVHWQTDHFESYAIARPKDRIVALYPHCSRGVAKHWLNAIKAWLKWVTIAIFFGTTFIGIIGLLSGNSLSKTLVILVEGAPIMALAFYPFFLLMTISLGWKWMSFVRLAERVFTAFGWERPSYIDLKQRSKDAKTETDANGYGVFFFRY